MKRICLIFLVLLLIGGAYDAPPKQTPVNTEPPNISAARIWLLNKRLDKVEKRIDALSNLLKYGIINELRTELKELRYLVGKS